MPDGLIFSPVGLQNVYFIAELSLFGQKWGLEEKNWTVWGPVCPCPK
jgi:hypothetical protein